MLLRRYSEHLMIKNLGILRKKSSQNIYVA